MASRYAAYTVENGQWTPVSENDARMGKLTNLLLNLIPLPLSTGAAGILVTPEDQSVKRASDGVSAFNPDNPLPESVAKVIVGSGGDALVYNRESGGVSAVASNYNEDLFADYGYITKGSGFGLDDALVSSVGIVFWDDTAGYSNDGTPSSKTILTTINGIEWSRFDHTSLPLNGDESLYGPARYLKGATLGKTVYFAGYLWFRPVPTGVDSPTAGSIISKDMGRTLEVTTKRIPGGADHLQSVTSHTYPNGNMISASIGSDDGKSKLGLVIHRRSVEWDQTPQLGRDYIHPLGASTVELDSTDDFAGKNPGDEGPNIQIFADDSYNTWIFARVIGNNNDGEPYYDYWGMNGFVVYHIPNGRIGSRARLVHRGVMRYPTAAFNHTTGALLVAGGDGEDFAKVHTMLFSRDETITTGVITSPAPIFEHGGTVEFVSPFRGRGPIQTAWVGERPLVGVTHQAMPDGGNALWLSGDAGRSFSEWVPPALIDLGDEYNLTVAGWCGDKCVVLGFAPSEAGVSGLSPSDHLVLSDEYVAASCVLESDETGAWEEVTREQLKALAEDTFGAIPPRGELAYAVDPFGRIGVFGVDMDRNESALLGTVDEFGVAYNFRIAPEGSPPGGWPELDAGLVYILDTNDRGGMISTIFSMDASEEVEVEVSPDNGGTWEPLSLEHVRAVVSGVGALDAESLEIHAFGTADTLVVLLYNALGPVATDIGEIVSQAFLVRVPSSGTPSVPPPRWGYTDQVFVMDASGAIKMRMGDIMPAFTDSFVDGSYNGIGGVDNVVLKFGYPPMVMANSGGSAGPM